MEGKIHLFVHSLLRSFIRFLACTFVSFSDFSKHVEVVPSDVVPWGVHQLSDRAPSVLGEGLQLTPKCPCTTQRAGVCRTTAHKGETSERRG